MNLVTVSGHHVNTIEHMLNHYKDKVNDIFIGVHRNSLSDEDYDRLVQITNDIGCGIYKEYNFPLYNWPKVTDIYNEIKMLKPDDWWIVSDDDEFHQYQNPLNDIIDKCEDENWKFVTGAFLDRVSEDGSLEKVERDINIFKQFPLGGMFRFPISQACPNKVVISKGDIQFSSGQHYAIIDGNEVRVEGGSKTASGVEHPYRCDVDWEFTQVHHFKWDESLQRRLNQIVDIDEEYTYGWEYKILIDYFRRTGGKIDLKDNKFKFQNVFIFPKHNSWDSIKHMSLDF
ncbi:hypothetical protein HOE22_09615 [Candidatus Woesearchaeota archaeon]|nr:hypothetical protein [Candidatus Woesearchaeota archaeon]MBT7558355.1 hypothetical protein [Candidatus Woesearchaeota archaeon]